MFVVDDEAHFDGDSGSSKFWSEMIEEGTDVEVPLDFPQLTVFRTHTCNLSHLFDGWYFWLKHGVEEVVIPPRIEIKMLQHVIVDFRPTTVACDAVRVALDIDVDVLAVLTIVHMLSHHFFFIDSIVFVAILQSQFEKTRHQAIVITFGHGSTVKQKAIKPVCLHHNLKQSQRPTRLHFVGQRKRP
jgi:hypothetical protein